MASTDGRTAGDDRPLKRVVIKEEFVALTGDHVKAAILDLLDQKQKDVKDFDRFIREEKARASAGGGEVIIDETAGWIYKDAAELAEETMLHASKQTMGRRLAELVEAGYVLRRRNPKKKWDQTYQYRLDLHKIRSDLEQMGYVLEGWYLPAKTETRALEIADSSMEIADSKEELRNTQNGTTKFHSDASRFQDGTAIPIGLIDDLDLPSVDQSVDKTDGQTEESREQEDQAPSPGSKAEALLNEIRGMAEEQVGDEAENMAGALVARFGDEGYELDEADTAKLTQLCLQKGRKNTLMRVAERVAKKEKVDHPFRYLVKSVAEEPAESGLAARVRERAASGAPRSGAERRREGYEWLFGDGS